MGGRAVQGGRGPTLEARGVVSGGVVGGFKGGLLKEVWGSPTRPKQIIKRPLKKTGEASNKTEGTLRIRETPRILCSPHQTPKDPAPKTAVRKEFPEPEALNSPRWHPMRPFKLVPLLLVERLKDGVSFSCRTGLLPLKGLLPVGWFLSDVLSNMLSGLLP